MPVGLLGAELQLRGAIGRPSPSQHEEEFSKGHSCARRSSAPLQKEWEQRLQSDLEECGLEDLVVGRRRYWAGHFLMFPCGALEVLWSPSEPVLMRAEGGQVGRTVPSPRTTPFLGSETRLTRRQHLLDLGL